MQKVLKLSLLISHLSLISQTHPHILRNNPKRFRMGKKTPSSQCDSLLSAFLSAWYYIPLSVYHVPCSIYYRCTCSVQAFWKIKHIINTLFSKHLLLPLVRQTPRYWRRRNALDRINGICKSDSIFSFLNPLHNIFPFIDIIRHAYFFSNRKIHCLHFKSLCEQNKQKHMQAMRFRLPVYRLPLNIVPPYPICRTEKQSV